jgi:Uma2 family endonuclease
MSTLTTWPPAEGTVASLIAKLGDIPPERIWLHPIPGTATEQDAVRVNEKQKRLCELIDGVLVEKPMGFYEGRLGMLLGYFLETYFSKNSIGFAIGSDGMLEYEPGQIRLPDVSVFLWHRFPGRILPHGAILRMTPDLAVEVLSPTNTRKEMERKLREVFTGGGKQVWHVDPDEHIFEVFTALDQSTVLGEGRMLDGGSLLPGFSLPIKDFFALAGRRAGPER